MPIIPTKPIAPAIVTGKADAVATAVPADNPADHLLNRLSSRWDDFLSALDSSNFYYELSMILVALTLAWIMSQGVKKIIKNKISTAPPKLFEAASITKSLVLVGPILALIVLWAVQLISILFDIGGNITAGVFQLTYAFFLIQCVTLVISSRIISSFISFFIILDAALRAIRINRSTSAYLDSLAIDIGKYHITALHLVHGIVIFVVVFWGAGLLSRSLENYLRRSTTLSHNARELTVKFFRLFVYLIAFVITLSAVGIDLTAFAVFGGALGVGVGLGLQKLTSNFLSGVTMLMEKSVKIGDLIEVGGNTGWVRQLNIRYALIETFDGREIMIPNEELVSTRVINWTLNSTMARVEITVTIDLDSDAEKASQLLLEAALEHPKCQKEPAAACTLKEINLNGIQFMLTFWIADIKQGRAGPQSDVLFSVLRKFRQNQVALARTA